jgi:hypothetical protein
MKDGFPSHSTNVERAQLPANNHNVNAVGVGVGVRPSTNQELGQALHLWLCVDWRWSKLQLNHPAFFASLRIQTAVINLKG